MQGTEQFFLMGLFIALFEGTRTHGVCRMKSLSANIFLYSAFFPMLKVALTIFSFDFWSEILKCDHSNESY